MLNLRRLIIVFGFLSCSSLSATQAQTCHPESIPSSTPTARFTNHGNGTVTDTRTGLMWKLCGESQTGADCTEGHASIYSWQAALLQAREVNQHGGFAGYTDWRVPNIRELQSIIERQCVDPAINLTVFPNASSTWHWSGSPNAYYSNDAWVVSFYNGYSDYNNRNNNYAVRLVRGGQ